MVQQSLVGVLSLVGLSMSLPLFAVAVRQFRGSAFGNVLATLSAAVALGLASTLVSAVPVALPTARAVVLVLVGGVAVLSTASALQLVRMTSGRCSL